MRLPGTILIAGLSSARVSVRSTLRPSLFQRAQTGVSSLAPASTACLSPCSHGPTGSPISSEPVLPEIDVPGFLQRKAKHRHLVIKEGGADPEAWLADEQAVVAVDRG
jgi:hypothetical protein